MLRLVIFIVLRRPARREQNWIKPSLEREAFAYFRIYGPEQAAFDKSWRPGDFEEVK